MKIALTGVALAALTTASASAQDVTITIPGILPSVDACENAWRSADSVEMAATVFIAAMITYEFDPDTAMECYRRIVSDRNLSNGQLDNDFMYRLEVGPDRYPEIARSYVDGAVPENDYELPETPWDIVFTRDDRYNLGDGEWRVKVYTSGQPTSRPITLRENEEGALELHEFSTLFVGVAAPG